MVDWPATLNTMATLVAGGALTMATQALADRRARRRDREKQRGTFLLQNFTVQREAIMQIQELVEQFSRRLEGEWQNCFWDSALHYLPSAGGRLSDDQAGRDMGTDLAVSLIAFHRQREARLSITRTLDFQKEFDTFVSAFKINVERAGSQSIETTARDYLRAALAESMGWANDLGATKDRLQSAISKALKEGPFAE
jgi:hypothetical protein